MDWKEVLYEDIELHVRVRLANEGAMDYEVRDVFEYDDGTPPLWRFQRADSTWSPNPTTNVEKGETLVTGWIKFDGCSHNDFSPYIHACDREEMVRIGVIFDRLFDLALELMPRHAEFLARDERSTVPRFAATAPPKSPAE